jgi:hypothetical protein
MRSAIFLALGLVALCLAACDQTAALLGPTEPIAVQGGSFLPGSPPRRTDGVAVTSIESASGIAVTGQRDRALGGRVDEDAYAIAIRLQDLGTGWWIAPIEAVDPAVPGERTFTLRYDLGAAVPPGLRRLELAAVDAAGALGPGFELDLCVTDPRIPDNLNECDPNLKPPAAAVVLHWDRDVDLDLRVRTPEGKIVSWKKPTTASGDAAGVDDDALDAETTGRLTWDSGAGCVHDGRNVESVIWPELPGDGPYSIYVRMFDACGQPETPFEAFVYRRRERDDGTFTLEQTDARAGALLELTADGGAKPPLFLLDVDLD